MYTYILCSPHGAHYYTDRDLSNSGSSHVTWAGRTSGGFLTKATHRVLPELGFLFFGFQKYFRIDLELNFIIF